MGDRGEEKRVGEGGREGESASEAEQSKAKHGVNVTDKGAEMA